MFSTSNNTNKTKFVEQLNETISLGNAILDRLHRRTQETLVEDLKNLLRAQIQEEKEQLSRLRMLIANYGGKPTSSKADLLSLNSLADSATDAMRKREVNNTLKSKSQNEGHDSKNNKKLSMTPQQTEILNTKEDALIKNVEIQAYKKGLKEAEKINAKDAVNILKQNLQEAESTYDNIRTSESKMLTIMRNNNDHLHESFNLGSAVADMLTSYWNSKENPSKVYLFNRRVHHGTIGALLGLSGLYKNSPMITSILSGLGAGLQKSDYNDFKEWFLFERKEDAAKDSTLSSIANKEKLEEKLGKALGLEKAAQLAVEELSAKGLLDEGIMNENLQTMKKQDNKHQTNLKELVQELVSDGLSSEIIQKTASETEQKASEIMKIYLGVDPHDPEAIEFLCLAEGGEVIHYEVLSAIVKEVKNRNIVTKVKAILAEEKIHLQLCIGLAKQISAASSAL
jgi:ferritin-like metal-binding protein YciE